MSDMVERVAKALDASYKESSGPLLDDPWEVKMRRMACAAILAMREPPETMGKIGMIERLDRHIRDYLGDTGDYLLSEALSDEDARSFLCSLIAAMREPTEAMDDAGTEHIGDTCDGHGIDAAEVWRAMIDAAVCGG